MRGWLLSAALLAVAPKCILCMFAYAGLGAALVLVGPELCGTAESTTPATGLATIGAVLAMAALIGHRLARLPVSIRP